MAGVELALVDRIAQTPVHLLSSLAQNPARAEKKRSRDVADKWHTRQSQQQLLFWLVISHGADQDELGNSLGIIQRDCRRDRATVRSSNNRRLIYSQPIHQTHHCIGL